VNGNKSYAEEIGNAFMYLQLVEGALRDYFETKGNVNYNVDDSLGLLVGKFKHHNNNIQLHDKLDNLNSDRIELAHFVWLRYQNEFGEEILNSKLKGNDFIEKMNSFISQKIASVEMINDRARECFVALVYETRSLP
jgi:hypothetical protein